MSWFGRYIKSSVGAKHVMAVTGLALLGFVVAHMIGNLKVFFGPESLNGYAAGLKRLGALLWIMRIGLLMAVLLHIGSAVRLVTLNKAARPVSYRQTHREKSTFASRVMPMSGLIVLAFLIFHLLQFTFGGGPLADDFNQIDYQGRHDVYNMVVSGFSKVPVAIAYVVAMLVLCLHLSHGIRSVFQSLGVNHPKYNWMFEMAGPMLAGLILVGNCSMPIACMAGWVKVAI